jgi:hypothetical protein
MNSYEILVQNRQAYRKQLQSSTKSEQQL